MATLTNNEKLKALLKKTGLSSREAAKIVGVNATSIRRWMCGDRNISTQLLAQVAKEVKKWTKTH